MCFLEVENKFERALDAILMRVFHEGIQEMLASGARMPSIAVGFSGGLDSTVLLWLSRRVAEKYRFPLMAFHVHHGLSRHADEWLDHCTRMARNWAIPFDSAFVKVDRQSPDGVEADARNKRYTALEALCEQHHVDLLLVAHHQNDQIETILMHMMRGSGLDGLTGMELSTGLPVRHGNSGVFLGRPLLAFSRRELEELAQANGLLHVEDDSNTDIRYTRNAIRHRLVPVISDIFPGFERRMAQMALHLADGKILLKEVASGDLERCVDAKNRLDLSKLALLTRERRENLLRFWMKAHAVQIPSTSWFLQLENQIFNAREDAQIRVGIGKKVIRKYRSFLSVHDAEDAQVFQPETVVVDWDGQQRVRLDTWCGVLEFEQGETGLDPEWLRAEGLRIEPYRGAASIRLANRPTKKLKNLCQEASIPPWERQFMPLVYVRNELVFVGGLGMSERHITDRGKGIRLRWKSTVADDF